jgi:hypothetical protein
LNILIIQNYTIISRVARRLTWPRMKRHPKK